VRQPLKQQTAQPDMKQQREQDKHSTAQQNTAGPGLRSSTATLAHRTARTETERERERERERESDTGKTAMMQGMESERTRGKKCAEQIVAD